MNANPLSPPRSFLAGTLSSVGRVSLLTLCLGVGGVRGGDESPEVLPGTRRLEAVEDLSERMAAGISDYFERETYRVMEERASSWSLDFASAEALADSVEANRQRLARLLGVVDARLPVRDLERVGTLKRPSLRGETEAFELHAVRWPVLEGLSGEGLLLQPKGAVRARIVLLPDADQTPETWVQGEGESFPAIARRLAENGCQVVVPVLIDRACAHSGNEGLGRYTNQPHREWIYRQAYTFGRHPIGFEVQKVSALLDWFEEQNRETPLPLGMAGWGEGGLVAFYTAALDRRVEASLVSGYFNRRERLWTEPLYRNVFGLLKEFGDAEIACLIAPRPLIVEHARAPQVEGPPAPLPGVPARTGASAAPGRIDTPHFSDVAHEVERAKRLLGPYQDRLHFHYRDADKVIGAESDRTLGPMAEEVVVDFLQALGLDQTALEAPGEEALPAPEPEEVAARQKRQVEELSAHLQGWVERSRLLRDEYLWNQVPISSPEAWDEAMEPYRQAFREEIHGRLAVEDLPPNPQSRKLFERETWTAYELTLDLAKPDLFVWGYLLLPKNLAPGERRPVIVAQHGGTGVPAVVINEDPATNKTYKAYAVQLVEMGYVVFAPHFPWRTQDRFFRLAERKAQPLGQNTFAVIFAQHSRLLDWLTAQPWTDPERIGFYGLSWGGKVAMRVPALEPRYALSICSGDFNEWIWKCVTTSWGNSYMYVPEYETPNFGLGLRFGHAEMAAMIAPRAFMVERGHADGVGIDEWVAFEYARVNRLYSKLKIPEKTEIEFFDGGHEIHAQGTFEFLRRQFGWPPEPTEEGR